MIPLEDHFEDILGKALRGNGVSSEVLSFLTGVELGEIEKLKAGELNEVALKAVASSLGLDADTLLERALKTWRPEEVTLHGLRQFNSLFDDDPEDPMTVNSYLVWDQETKEAALFDTGADAGEALSFIKEKGLHLKALFLTHTHLDHIIDREKVIAAHPDATVYVNGREPVAEAVRFVCGESFAIGGLQVSTRLTWGHSPAGTTYLIEGLARPLAVVGDALFAQSMGGGVISYHDALATNRAEIFTLADETVICPGHGPMTSVAEEKVHNPFYPEFK